MYQAAIVEDERAVARHLRTALGEAFRENGLAVEFDLYPGGEAFLSAYETGARYDVLFLDVEMPGMDGFSLCRRIRASEPEALVIFVSNREELVFQSFEVQPFRFMRKNSFDLELPALVRAVCQELARRTARTIRLTERPSGDICVVHINALRFAEAQRKDCRLVSDQGESLLRVKFMDLEEKLLPLGFLKIHRSFLVNPRYIFRIGKTSLVLTSGEELPISRGRAEEIKTAYLHYLSEG